MICDITTWIPHYHILTLQCHALRHLYYIYGLQGASGFGLGGRNCATIFYWRHLGGNLCYVTCSSENGPAFARHSERVCRDELLVRENWTLPQASMNILSVYTERFPCGADLANCRALLQNWLQPNCQVFWSYDYPDSRDLKRKRDDGDDGDDGDDHDARREAKRRRHSGTREHKRDFTEMYKPLRLATAKTSSSHNDMMITGEIADPQLLPVLLKYRETRTLYKHTAYTTS